MLTKLSIYWASLPHAVRTAIVLFGGAAGGVLKHSLSQPNACFTGPCLHGYIVSGRDMGWWPHSKIAFILDSISRAELT